MTTLKIKLHGEPFGFSRYKFMDFAANIIIIYVSAHVAFTVKKQDFPYFETLNLCESLCDPEQGGKI